MSRVTTSLQLPRAAEELLAQVDSGAVLGASRQLHVVGDCLTVLATEHAADAASLRSAVRAVEEHLRRTRGASSQAVTNGVALMTRPLDDSREPVEDGELGRRLLTSVDAFRASLSGWQVALRDHATALLAGHSTVLAYDYSSSVSQAVDELAATDVDLRVFVPEARSLDGGRKYLADWRDTKVTVHLVPDAAIGWAVQRCDAVLAGAETLSAEGGCYNTIGTAVAANEAARRDVPFYVLSVLLKTDLGTAGDERPSPSLDFLSLAHVDPPVMDVQRAVVRGGFPDLDYTEPAAIAAVITECGALSPSDVAAAARTALGTGKDEDG